MTESQTKIPLQNLIAELCLDGVEFKTLGDVCEITRGVRVTKKDLLPNGKYPVVSGGIGFMGYLDDYNREAETITIAQYGTAGYVKWQQQKFWANDVCFSVIPNEKIILNKYLYYFLANNQEYLYSISNRDAIPYSIDRAKILKIKVPVPPMEVQREIVRILDKFTELGALLEKELVARKKQYEYYTDKLLSFRDDEVVYQRLGDCCFLEKGNTPIQKAIAGEYPLVVTTAERKTSNNYQFDKPSVCIPLISSRGHGVASLNQIYYQEGKFALGNILCAVTPIDENFLCAKFLRYYLNYRKNSLLVPLMRGGANVSMTVDSLKRIKVAIPPLPEQQRIAGILDRFDSLCNDLSSGIPAEIAARKKQYEYYRDRLLTFKEKNLTDGG